jgi:D-tyrosyl-tRNA(Tyr) deacylase
MKVIIQRVLSGSVTVDGTIVGQIGPGLVVLLGITHDDTPTKISQTVNRVLNIRLWENDGKRWDMSVMDKNFEVLIVSQFTLYSVLKGNKPDFHNAMAGEQAREFYERFIEEARNKYRADRIQTGAFGQYMNVSLVNDGPVTIEVNY